MSPLTAKRMPLCPTTSDRGCSAERSTGRPTCRSPIRIRIRAQGARRLVASTRRGARGPRARGGALASAGTDGRAARQPLQAMFLRVDSGALLEVVPDSFRRETAAYAGGTRHGPAATAAAELRHWLSLRGMRTGLVRTHDAPRVSCPRESPPSCVEEAQERGSASRTSDALSSVPQAAQAIAAGGEAPAVGRTVQCAAMSSARVSWPARWRPTRSGRPRRVRPSGHPSVLCVTDRGR